MQRRVQETPTEWRCQSCGALLGIHIAHQVIVKVRQVTYRVSGRVETSCRRCAKENAAEVSPAASSVALANCHHDSVVPS